MYQNVNWRIPVRINAYNSSSEGLETMHSCFHLLRSRQKTPTQVEAAVQQEIRGHEAREAARLPRGRPCELDPEDVVSRSKGPRAGSCRGEHLRRLRVYQEVQ